MSLEELRKRVLVTVRPEASHYFNRATPCSHVYVLNITAFEKRVVLLKVFKETPSSLGSLERLKSHDHWLMLLAIECVIS